MQIHMQQYIPKPISQGKVHNQEEFNHGTLKWKETIIHGCRCVWCRSGYRSSARKGKNVVSKEWSTQQCSTVGNNIYKEKPDKCRGSLQQHTETSASYTIWPRKIPPLMFCLLGKSDHRPQTAGSNIQERCSKPITKASYNATIDTPVQHQNTIQTRAASVHHRLAIEAQPWNKYRWRSTKHMHKHSSNRIMHGHTGQHQRRRNKRVTLESISVHWQRSCSAASHP